MFWLLGIGVVVVIVAWLRLPGPLVAEVANILLGAALFCIGAWLVHELRHALRFSSASLSPNEMGVLGFYGLLGYGFLEYSARVWIRNEKFRRAEEERWREHDAQRTKATSREAARQPNARPERPPNLPKEIVEAFDKAMAETEKMTAAKYYLLHGGSVLARVDDPLQTSASVFRDGKWVSTPHVALKVTGMGGDSDFEDVAEEKARELFPGAFP